MLLGSGFERETMSLVIFDIAKAQKTIIHSTELVTYGWPILGPREDFTAMAYHSGLLILRYRKLLLCFKLSGLPLRPTRLNPPEQFAVMCNNARVLAINREFICVVQIHTLHEPDDLLLFSRDFILKGKIKFNGNMYQLHIRGKTIIGLTDRCYSLEFWQIKDTNDPLTSLVHFRSILISQENELRKSHGHEVALNISHNPDTIIMHNGFCFYSGSDKIAEFNSVYTEIATSKLGCVDMLTAQHFAVYKVANTKSQKVITFEISNIRFLRGVKKIKVSVPLDLGALLDCQMYFTTIVLLFASGIARFRLKRHESIHQKTVDNSSNVCPCVARRTL
jgi:hypothetical protein